MKKTVPGLIMLFCLPMVCSVCFSLGVQAKDDDRIKAGIYADDIDLGGMTVPEAETAIRDYVDLLGETEFVLRGIDGMEVVVPVKEFGISWANREICEEAVRLGTQGNIVQRYKACEDLLHENRVYPIELSYDLAAIDGFVEENFGGYDRPAVDADLTREDGEFTVVEGREGYALNIEASGEKLYDYLTDEWDRGACKMDLVIEVLEPRGSAEELAMVKDVLGSYSTSYASSDANRKANVENGCRLVNGTLLYPGDEFSTCDKVSPFTEENGYYLAGSYLNGQVVDSVGGGICQVSTTLYNAVLRSELEVTQRNNHSMTVSYVKPAEDAAIATSSGKDFKFVNDTEYPVYIEGYTHNRTVTFVIYGVETRPENRKIEFAGEVLETIEPDGEVIYTDASKPLGYVSVTGAHIGYKARLWKIVKVDGVEVERSIVNQSNYRVSPRSAVIGVSTEDVYAYNTVMAAAATGDIDYVKSIIAALKAAPVVTPDLPPAEE